MNTIHRIHAARPCKNPLRHALAASAAVLLAAGLATHASASQTINVNFANTGGEMNGKSFTIAGFQQAPAVYTGSTWNDFIRADTTALTAIASAALLDSDGNATAMGFTTDSSPQNVNFMQGPRSWSDHPDVTLLKSGLYRVAGSGSGNTINTRFVVTGLDPLKLYHIYLACSADLNLNNRWGIGTATASPATFKDILNTAATKTAQTWKPGDNWLVFYNVAPDTAGKIYVWGYNLNGGGGYSGLTLNGFQVVDATGWQNSDKSLYDFGTPAVPGSSSVISDHGTGNNITWTLPYHGTDLAALAPTFTLADFATCSPASGDPVDFSNSQTTPVDYTVTAEDHSTKVYHVTANVTPAGNQILTFKWGTLSGAINETDHTIALTVPLSTDVTTLNPTCTLSPYASSSPASGDLVDFTNPVEYTVTAEDATTQIYTVTVYFEAAANTIRTMPSGLAPGTQYRLIFVTSTETHSGGADQAGLVPPGFLTVAEYDAFATNTATAVSALASLNTTWKAVITTRSPNSNATTNTATDPSVNASTSVPIYQLGGMLVATGYADLWDGTIASPINRNELGGPPAAQYAGGYNVWTGANASGTNAGAGNALINQDGGYISIGTATATDASWITGLGPGDPNARHNDLMPIYAISGMLTVPEPQSPLCDMVAFTWGTSPVYHGVIDQLAVPKTVTLHVPHTTSLNLLDPNPAFAVSPLATCDKQNGGTPGLYNFSTPQTYKVTAADADHNQSYQVTVIADVPEVTLAISPPGGTMSEDGGTATVTATLTNPSLQDVTVNLAYSGTAPLGAGYTRSATSITILAGDTSGFVTLTGVQDNVFRPDTTVVVDISTVVNGLETTPQQVTATITNTTLQPTIVAPTGINPATGWTWANGDTYQLVFVTSTTRGSADRTIDPYNAFVNAAAASSTLPGIPNIMWHAIGTAFSDAATAPARVNAPVTGPVYLVDGTTLVAAGFADLWDGSIANGINLNQSGATVAAGTQVLTGTGQASGLPFNYPTGPFYQTFNADYARYGLVGSTDGRWISAGETTGAARMYALSIPLVHAGGVASAYEIWAKANAASSNPSEDSNHDGVANGVAFFMGMNGLATNPGVMAGKVTWPYVNAVASFMVQVSDNLADWADIVPPDPSIDESVPGLVTYTLPPGAEKEFCRLVVTP
ncbi:MAG: hypothetical protein NTW21_40905 [Verrucomicrobia bacterium]|nr:hypothetical protein [Verrucomicrobiota bacterium]